MIPGALQNHPVLSRYREVEPIGRGAFGHVFRGLCPDSGRPVAIKVLRIGQEQEILRRFSREARALASLHSPYLVELLDMNTDHEAPSLVMEWIPGGTLDRLYAPGQAAPPAQVRQVARDLLTGIEVLHQAGLLHRDLKPANVFFREDGTAVLGDLGLIGEETASELSRGGGSLGTPRYMPPEVLQGQRWSAVGDFFAIGLTLWEFAVGAHPSAFFGGSPAIFLNPDLRLPPLVEAGAYPNPALQRLLDGLLQGDPEQRPQDCQAARALLGSEEEASRSDAGALQGRPPPTPGPKTDPPGIHEEESEDEFAITQAGPVNRSSRGSAGPTMPPPSETDGSEAPPEAPSQETSAQESAAQESSDPLAWRSNPLWIPLLLAALVVAWLSAWSLGLL